MIFSAALRGTPILFIFRKWEGCLDYCFNSEYQILWQNIISTWQIVRKLRIELHKSEDEQHRTYLKLLVLTKINFKTLLYETFGRVLILVFLRLVLATWFLIGELGWQTSGLPGLPYLADIWGKPPNKLGTLH